ncbi:hypothetical protein NGRA_1922 [Nosema granulosis]|uniref:Uncharacterized protein n=1 Tax=Nosema granulosis TaxID=83296 RepID=A0A9P6H0B3_9MICR|nr:hypothetical protein NGRA_1922 [Nosema granulosis]
MSHPLSLLQILDLSINRSFKQHFDEKNNEWIYEAIEDKENRKKKGIIKKNTIRSFEGCVLRFYYNMNKKTIIKGLEICGILEESFDIYRFYELFNNLLLDEEVDETLLLNLNDTIIIEEEVFNDDLKDWLFIGKDSYTVFKIL